MYTVFNITLKLSKFVMLIFDVSVPFNYSSLLEFFVSRQFKLNLVVQSNNTCTPKDYL